MSLSYPHLLSPGQLGGIALPNRIVMAPMSRRDASPDGIPGEETAGDYRARAAAGLIVTGVVAVAPHGQGTPGAPGLHTPEQAEGWRAVTEAVHEAGGRIVVQLAHAGRLSHPDLQPDGRAPVAPSAILPEGPVQTPTGLQPPVLPRPLDPSDIAAIVADYAHAAALARQAGFDGVEIDAAGGKLIDQFLRPHTNRRSDRHGGSLRNRSRFFWEVLESVTGAFGRDRVGVRLSPVVTIRNSDVVLRDDEGAFAAILAELSETKLAYVALNERPEYDAAALRGFYADPNILASGGYAPDTAEQTIASGHAHAIGFASLFRDRPDFIAALRTAAFSIAD